MLNFQIDVFENRFLILIHKIKILLHFDYVDNVISTHINVIEFRKEQNDVGILKYRCFF